MGSIPAHVGGVRGISCRGRGGGQECRIRYVATCASCPGVCESARMKSPVSKLAPTCGTCNRRTATSTRRPAVFYLKGARVSRHRRPEDTPGQRPAFAQVTPVLETSVPTFIIKAGKLKYPKYFENPTYNGRGNVTGPHAQEAQMLLEPGVVSFARLSTGHGAIFIMNPSSDNNKDVTEARVADYIKSRKGTLRIPAARSEAGFDKLKKTAASTASSSPPELSSQITLSISC